MAKDVLVGRELTREMIDAGAQLLRKLDGSPVTVTHALWIYDSSQFAWQFLLYSPVVDILGPKNVFTQISALNDASAEEDYTIPLSYIGLLSTGHFLIQAINVLIGTGAKDVSEIRMTNNTINGYLLEDVMLYRSYQQ